MSSAKFARWRTYPNNQADPRLPIDERGGGLHRGESQQATEIISNDYALEATVGGNVVARFADLEQEENKMQVLYLVGDLSPSNDPEVLASRWLQQEVRIPTAPGGKETVTKPRAAEARTQNRPIKVDFKDIEVFHTNPITVPITARDPDGFVHAIDLVRVDPPVGSARLVDTSFRASEKMGGPASVELEIGSDFPPGRYDLTMLVNAETFADWALVTKTLRVRPIDIERLRSEVERFVVADEIQTPIAEEFDALLDATEAQLREDNLFAACDLLRRFAMTASQASGASLSISAGESLEREAEAFRARLGCPGCF